jgi:hypothetical protein
VILAQPTHRDDLDFSTGPTIWSRKRGWHEDAFAERELLTGVDSEKKKSAQ